MDWLQGRPRKEHPTRRKEWMPDPGVWRYVLDMLGDDFKVEVDTLPEHWIPIAVTGTLEWITVCGWWVFRNTGVFQPDTPYKYVFEFGGGYEFEPDHLIMFEEDPKDNLLEYRLKKPGITGIERSEALPFLADKVFAAWLRGEHDLTEEEAEQYIPPRAFLEIAMYATFMWVLDTYGRDWLYMQDEILACVFDYGVAYYEKFGKTLLDPAQMVCTERPHHSCRYCETVLWCVSGTTIGGLWQFVCTNCLIMQARTGADVDELDRRLNAPRCPHISAEGTCRATCKHSGISEEDTWRKLEEVGSSRVAAYAEQLAGGAHPLQQAGLDRKALVDQFLKGSRRIT